MRGRLTETNVEALERGYASVRDATLVGVVDPDARVEQLVGETRPALAQPPGLRADVDEREADFRRAGMCAQGAHNAAWEEVDAERRYREYLDGDDGARGACAELTSRLSDGESFVLVGRHPDGWASHGRVLIDVLGRG